MHKPFRTVTFWKLSLCLLLAFALNSLRGFADGETNQVPSAIHGAQGSESDDERLLLKLMHKDLGAVRYFAVLTREGTVGISLTGTAAENGINKSLSEFLTLKFKNTFAGFELRPLPKNFEQSTDAQGNLQYEGIDKNEWAIMHFRIWTVGKDYPVAYHVKMNINRLGGGAYGYSDEMLGYASAKDLTDTRLLKDTLADMMERAAVKILKLQGKM